MVGKVDRYTAFNWDQIKHEGDPLSLVLNRRMRVYVKVDRSKYIARTKSAVGLLVENTLRVIRAMARATGDSYVDELDESSSLPRNYGLSWDSDVYLLALDYASIREVWATGDCIVAKFESGGLKIASASNGKNVAGEDVVEEKDDVHDEVRFRDCYLIERTRRNEALNLQSPEDQQAFREQCAVSILIRREDIYLEKADVAVLERQGTSAWDAVDYPLETPDSRLPDAVFWMYQAAIAFNRDEVMERKGIKDWLRENASGGVFRKQWVRTADSVVPANGGMSRRIERTSGKPMHATESVPTKYVGSALRLVLALTEWWQTQLAEERWPRDELAGKLDDAGFEETAVIDLAGMITGEHLGKNETEKMKTYLGTRT